MVVRKRAWVVVVAGLALGLLNGSAAFAADDESEDSDFWRINVGARAWYNKWSTSFSADDGTGTVNTYGLDAEIPVIPQLSVRVQNFQLGASYLSKTEYKFKGFSVFDRDELDINLGYYVVPGLAASLGYKAFKISVPGASAKVTGPTVGLSSSMPLGRNFGFYASFAYGLLDSDDDDADYINYVLVEPGLSYLISTGNFLGLDAVVVTLGYRVQTLETKGLKDESSGFELDDTPRDMTRGVTLGFSASF